MKNLYSLSSELESLQDTFCYEVMKTYFFLNKNLFSDNYHTYHLSSSDLRYEAMPHNKAHLRLALHFDDSTTNSHIVTKHATVIIDKNTNPEKSQFFMSSKNYQLLNSFYENVFMSSNAFVIEIIKQHLNTLTPSAIKLDKTILNHEIEYAKKVLGDKYFIVYEKELLENGTSLVLSNKSKMKI